MALCRKAGEIRERWKQDTKVVLGGLYGDDMQPLPLCPVAWSTAPVTSANHITMLDVTEAERTAVSRLSCQLKMSAALDGIVPRVPQP